MSAQPTFAGVADNTGSVLIEQRIGSTEDSDVSTTLFGWLKKIYDALSKLDTISSKVDTVSSTVDSISGKVDGVQTTANSISGKVDTLQTSVNTLTSSASASGAVRSVQRGRENGKSISGTTYYRFVSANITDPSKVSIKLDCWSPDDYVTSVTQNGFYVFQNSTVHDASASYQYVQSFVWELIEYY